MMDQSPIQVRTRISKRQRVASPLASAAPVESIEQVSVADATIELAILEAQQLVESIKQAVPIVVVSEEEEVTIVSKKRVIAAVTTEEDYVVAPQTLYDVVVVDATPVDKRGFFGKLFRKAPKKTPTNAGREIKGVGSQIAVAVREDVDMEPEGRRWIAGFGLAVAVGATAAVPYLLG